MKVMPTGREMKAKRLAFLNAILAKKKAANKAMTVMKKKAAMKAMKVMKKKAGMKAMKAMTVSR